MFFFSKLFKKESLKDFINIFFKNEKFLTRNIDPGIPQ